MSNLTKSCDLKMICCDVGLNCKLGLSWNTKEQKIVCVFLRGDGAIAVNWTLIEEKVNTLVEEYTYSDLRF